MLMMRGREEPKMASVVGVDILLFGSDVDLCWERYIDGKEDWE